MEEYQKRYHIESNQPRLKQDHVSYEPLDVTFANLILPLTFLGVTILGILFVFLILILWWKKFKHLKPRWTLKQSDVLVKTMAEWSPNEKKAFKVEIVKEIPQKPLVTFVNEADKLRPFETARNYGGSSPKAEPEAGTSQEKDTRETDIKSKRKFVFPPQEAEKIADEVKETKVIPKFMIPLPEQQWLGHKKTVGYKATIPRPLAQIVKSEFGDQLLPTTSERSNLFSATRSPSLEKDDKSPFLSSAKSDKSYVFGFDTDAVKNISKSGHSSPASDVYEDRNFNNNVTSIVKDSDVMETSNLRRYRSVNTKLNVLYVTENPTFEVSEMQNSPSPRILECSSAKEKSSGTKFNFSPKLLSDNQNSPSFFTPTDKFSPFFSEQSPKSVYYDSVRSPKFFPSTPRSPPICCDSDTQSPKAFAENRNGAFSTEKQLSPRILVGKPRSPKVSNKENYFTFDSTNDSEQDTTKRITNLQRYGGRKSIERERYTPTEKIDVRKYRRHNSCDTNYKSLDSPKKVDDFSIEVNSNSNTRDLNSNLPDRDMIDCSIPRDFSIDIQDVTIAEQIHIRDLTISEHDTKDITLDVPDSSKNFTLSHPQTAHERRQRLKSISLDSDNAKIIEQNLGLPVAKQLKEEIESYKEQDISASCQNVTRTTDETTHIFRFDQNLMDTDKAIECESYLQEMQKKSLRDSSDPQAFIEMPRFSPKEFEITITPDDTPLTPVKKKGPKNLRNLTIDLSKRDTDLEQQVLEFEKLYTNPEEKKPKTPTLKIKATSLDSSESMNLSLPQKKTLEVPQNSVSVPNTPKRQYKRILAQKMTPKGQDVYCGGKMGYNSLQCDHRRFIKDSGIFLKENHANLIVYQPSRSGSRRMGSFDENMGDFAENTPEINVSDSERHEVCHQTLGSNLLNYKQNLSVSSTNLKTLPEGVPSNDFEPSEDEKFVKKLHRRGSNQSLMLSLDCGAAKYSNFSSQSSNCSLNSVGTSCHNLASIRNSASNFSLNTDNRQKKLILERRNSNASLGLNTELIPPTTHIICSSNLNLQSSSSNLSGESHNQSKNCLLQRRGSNNSLTLNIQASNSNLSRYSSNSSLNISKEKSGQRKGLLERRSSNTSLTLNINTSNPQLTVNRGLSISNYNLNGSTCNLSRYNSNQSINNPVEPKKGILERRSSNTSLTLNLHGNDAPRDLEIDDKIIDDTLKDAQYLPHREKHRKSLSTENLMPKSYKNRVRTLKTNENPVSFGSHDNLWSNSYADNDFQEPCGQNLTYVCGDQENELIYAVGPRQLEEHNFVRNITTKPLSPQTTSEDFKIYLANIQHLQNATTVLSRQQLQDLNDVFQNGYSKVKCETVSEGGHNCSGKVDETEVKNAEIAIPDATLPCSEYQKALLRNLHQEFWDLPTNFQEKPLVFGSHPKNRYKTILPNEHSRVILKGYGSDDAEGYINANFIKGHDYSKDSYIATQAPLQNTIYDFWLMVRQNSKQFRNNPKTNEDRQFGTHNIKEINPDSPKENNIQKVVMLTNFIENNNQKCEKYFPIEVNEEVTFESTEISTNFFTDNRGKIENDCHKCFVIKNSGVIKKTGYTISKLNVMYKCQKSSNCEHVFSENLSKGDENDDMKDRFSKSYHRKSLERETNLLSVRRNDKSLKREYSQDQSDEMLFKNESRHDESDISEKFQYLSESKYEKSDETLLDSELLQLERENTQSKRIQSEVMSDTSEIFKEMHLESENTQYKGVQSEIINTESAKLSDNATATEIPKVDLDEIVVYHYWFHNWADHKCPKDVNSLLNLSLDILEDTTYNFNDLTSETTELCTCSDTEKTQSTKFVFPPLKDTMSDGCFESFSSRKLLNLNFSELNSPPTIVHCSAGIGRTGCLIAILNGIKQLNFDQKVDVLGIVCNMRLNRGGMVQNSEQYELIHKVLCLYEQIFLPKT